MNNSRYENLWNIIVGYFHEDFDLFGKDLFEIIDYHKSVSNEIQIKSAIDEIDKFKSKNPDSLDSAFKHEFGDQFNPRTWGYTTESFLDELKRLLQE